MNQEISADHQDAIDCESTGRHERPETVPEKFWDSANGTVRTDNLLQSYIELEKRLGNSLPWPNDEDHEGRNRIFGALGRPDSPDDYVIDADVTGSEPDPELNKMLHEAGFTQAQANLVYRLASERLAPLLEEATIQAESAAQQIRLEHRFGGTERWQQIASDIQKWGENKFGAEALDAIASSYEGVIALHSMMNAGEPEIIGNAESGPASLSEAQLNEMVADPRYWRDHDPDFVARVSEGYVKLFSD